MYMLLLMMLVAFSQQLDAINSAPVKRIPKPLTIAQELAIKFGDQIIQLTDTEYKQLVSLPPLNQYIAPDRSVMVKDLFTILLSDYALSRPHIMCIRAPCPQPSILIISKGTTNIEINLTDSPFSAIINSLNI